uniref:Galectin domain-containing protein n=1 Tax=Ananas comosus var. bracteatus TaxID=296719 RepID=A0A6V7QBU8_ANACO|nr:unnamed protein product [Ananas comosus var. bracteatus]
MKRSKLDVAASLGRHWPLHAILALALLYVALLVFYELLVSSRVAVPGDGLVGGGGGGGGGGDGAAHALHLGSEEAAPVRPSKQSYRILTSSASSPPPLPDILRRRGRAGIVSGLDFRQLNATGRGGPFSELHRAARDAWEVGRKLFEELRASPLPSPASAAALSNRTEEEKCPHSIIMTGAEFRERGRLMVLPCGLTLGSHLTLVAKPYPAHPNTTPRSRF